MIEIADFVEHAPVEPEVVAAYRDRVPAELVEVCERVVSISQYGSTRSLNAGAAAAIAMYHWALQWALPDNV